MYEEEYKYTVDVFTEHSVGTKFPENSYFRHTPEQVAKIIKDCSAEISGIIKIEVWINYYGD
jgi:hypothetical protein